jgi:predicted dehydrogenase
MSEKIKLGIVGLGQRGSNMLDIAVNSFDYVIPAAVCEIEKKLLAVAKEKYPSAKIYGDYAEMLHEVDLDAILVETPADNHASFCARALERGINVFPIFPVLIH